MKCIYTAVFTGQVIEFDIIPIVKQAFEHLNNQSKNKKLIVDDLTYANTDFGYCVVWYGENRTNKIMEVYQSGVFNILDSRPNLKFIYETNEE